MSQHTAPGPPASPGTSAGFVFDARRWSGYEVAAGGLSLLLLALVSAPWFGIRFTGCPPQDGFTCQVSVTGTVHGTVHGYMWATIVPTLVILAMLVLRAGYDTVPFLRWPSDRQLLAGAACANLLIVVAAFLAKPGYIPLPDPRHLPVEPVPPPILAVSWEWGAYLTLALAAAAATAAILSIPAARARLAGLAAPGRVTSAPSRPA